MYFEEEKTNIGDGVKKALEIYHSYDNLYRAYSVLINQGDTLDEYLKSIYYNPNIKKQTKEVIKEYCLSDSFTNLFFSETEEKKLPESLLNFFINPKTTDEDILKIINHCVTKEDLALCKINPEFRIKFTESINIYICQKYQNNK